ncbi:MAG: Lrp/AsnC ligand binding domain-containing protein [Methanobacteriota archaeon]
MVVAVCFINAKLGEEVKIRRKLGMFQGVRGVIELFGEYDFMIIIETGDLRQVNFIIDSIRKLKGVAATKTLVGAY